MARKPAGSSGRIRVGVGGWSFAPWRGVFYPKGLKQADELGYAASHLTSIEINATHYRLQSAKSFKSWSAAAPQGFVFSVKGPRLVTQQKVLAETGGFIKRFLASGLAELGDKLGPVLWQFAPFKRFERDDLARFIEHLPRELDGLKLNHVIEARHASFRIPTLSGCSATRARAPLSPTPRRGPRSAMSRATSSMQGCNAAMTILQGPIRRRSSTAGPSEPRSGPTAVFQTTCRSSMRAASTRRNRATFSSISSTRESCGRLPQRWR